MSYSCLLRASGGKPQIYYEHVYRLRGLSSISSCLLVKPVLINPSGEPDGLKRRQGAQTYLSRPLCMAGDKQQITRFATPFLQNNLHIICRWTSGQLLLLLLLLLWLYSPVLGLSRFFSFLILYTVGRTPWTGDQPVARPLPTHRTTQTHNKRTQYRPPCLEWDSNPRSQCPSGRRQFMP
jgi:hypothetical protein